MRGLQGDDFITWMTLRRVRRGGLAKMGDRYLDQGRPVPDYLQPDLVAELIAAGLLAEAEPDEGGLRRVTLTDLGQARYTMLGRRQRGRPDLNTRPAQPAPSAPAGDDDRAATRGYLDALYGQVRPLTGLFAEAAALGECCIPVTVRWMVFPADSRRHVLTDDGPEFRGVVLARCGRYLPGLATTGIETTGIETSPCRQVPLCGDCAAIVAGPPRFGRT